MPRFRPGAGPGSRYRERMAGVSEKVAGHIASMDADSILTRSAQVEKIDNAARRTFGLDSPATGSGAVNLNVLCGGGCAGQPEERIAILRSEERRVGKESRSE